MRSFVKIWPSRNADLLFVIHALVANFNVANMSLNAVCEKMKISKIIKKIRIYSRYF